MSKERNEKQRMQIMCSAKKGTYLYEAPSEHPEAHTTHCPFGINYKAHLHSEGPLASVYGKLEEHDTQDTK